MDKPIWQPSAERIASANLTAFMAAVERDRGRTVEGYSDLHDFSVGSPERFWTSVWDFCGLMAERRGEEVVRFIDRMPGAQWFPGARLNFAQNLLRRRDSSDALVYLREDRGVRRMSFARLHDEVSRARQALSAAGVRPGDRVAGYLPNMPETVVAMLATTSLGAIWCACSPDFGVEAAVDRFGQVDPAILLTADAYSYNGRTHSCLDKAAAIADRLPSLARVVLISNLGSDAHRDAIPNAVAWEDFLGPFPPGEIDFPQFDFNHPVLILYTSGTTGPPKCILHGAGGILIENLKGTALNFDVKPGDRIFWWTTSGWVVWYFLVLALGCEATLLLYDGSPSYPSPAALMDFAAAERATFMRLSPRFVDIMADAGLEPARTHDLGALKTITVAGAPFSTAGYRYIYEKVKSDVHLASPAGGTDPMASLVCGGGAGMARRHANRAVRAASRAGASRRRTDREDQDPAAFRRLAPPHSGSRDPGRRHSAHQHRQGLRVRGARGDSRPRGDEPRRSGEPRGLARVRARPAAGACALTAPDRQAARYPSLLAANSG